MQKEKNSPLTKRYLWADIIRITAIFLVVYAHTAPSIPQTFSSQWVVSFFLYPSFSRIAVPLFILLSGALLLGKKEDSITFFKKRASKIFIPWLVWSGIYLLWILYNDPGIASSLVPLFNTYYIVFMSQFWFLPMLAILYLFTPLVRHITTRASKKELVYGIFVWFGLVSVLPFLSIITNQGNIPINNSYTIQHFGYFLAGFVVVSSRFSSKALLPMLLITVSSLLINTIGASFFASRGEWLISGNFNYNASPFIVIASTGAFLVLYLASNIFQERISLLGRRIVTVLSKASFGIFFVHMLIIFAFSYFGYGFEISVHDPFAFPLSFLKAVFIFLLSFVVIAVLQQIPFIRKIVP